MLCTSITPSGIDASDVGTVGGFGAVGGFIEGVDGRIEEVGGTDKEVGATEPAADEELTGVPLLSSTLDIGVPLLSSGLEPDPYPPPYCATIPLARRSKEATAVIERILILG